MLPLLLLSFAFAGDPAPVPPAEEDLALEVIRAQVAHFVDDPAQAEALIVHLDASVDDLATDLATHGGASPTVVRAALLRNVADNLGGKVVLDEALPFPLTASEIQQTVIDYEVFKARSYVSSGVFPKRYFGYFDLKSDTAVHEWSMRQTVHCATETINAYQLAAGATLRVDDAEIAVTFIAEGGALLLREDQHRMNDLHPVFDVGLDDLAKGAESYPGLMAKLDTACGTDVSGLVVYTEPGAAAPPGAVGRLQSNPDRWSWLMRNATFEEGIVGTAMMWIWEKEIAARKLAERGSTPLHARDRVGQFIVGSLVYNSGIAHSESTIRAIEGFSTGDYLFTRSEDNAHRRPRLNLLPPPGQLTEWLADGDYRAQPTSWVAVYHVLQRYGAWVALHRFTDLFDEQGMFAPREEPRSAPSEAASPPPAPPVDGAPEPEENPMKTRRWCDSVGARPTPLWWGGLLLIAVGWRRGVRTPRTAVR